MTLLITIIGIVFTIEEKGAVNKDLVLAYDFEKIQGNTVKDASKHGNDGELMGDPQMAESVMGQALAFDGEDDRLNLGSDASLNPTDALTIVAWIFIERYTAFDVR